MKKQPRERGRGASKGFIRVNVLTQHVASAYVLSRQSPARKQSAVIWKNLRVVFNQKILPDDRVVVWHYPPYKKTFWHSLAKKLSIPFPTKLIDHPRAQKIHIQTEPMTLPFARVIYSKKFLSQFGTVVAQYPRPRWYQGGDWLQTHGGLEWWYGFAQSKQKSAKRVINKTWQGLLASPKKTKVLSVIASRQHMTAQQKKRIKFVDALAADAELINSMDVFGSKRNFIVDKAMGLEKYKYHVALENSLIADYWTEKLADPLLAECFVFYAGAPNIGDYFDTGSIMALDISKPAAAIKIIKQTIASGAYEKNSKAIAENKRRVMMEENFFNLLWRVVNRTALRK